MASPFQKQARDRKFVYIGLIIVLFTFAWFWRHYNIDAQASKLAIREINRGDVELSGSVIRLTLTGSRGLATCALWISAIDKQKKNQWNELELLVRSLTKSEKRFFKLSSSLQSGEKNYLKIFDFIDARLRFFRYF